MPSSFHEWARLDVRDAGGSNAELTESVLDLLQRPTDPLLHCAEQFLSDASQSIFCPGTSVPRRAYRGHGRGVVCQDDKCRRTASLD